MIGTILSYGIAGMVGFITGITVQFGYLKMHGKRIVLPFISNSSRTITLAAIGLALLSLFTIVQVQISDEKRVQCQIEYQSALQYNTDLNVQEAALREQERNAQNEVNSADGDLIFEIAGLVNKDPAATPDELQAPFLKYIDRRNAADGVFKQITAERMQNQQDRKPYPAPNCGEQ